MRWFSAPVRLAAACALCASTFFFAPHTAVRAGDDLPQPFDASLVDRSKNACTDFFAYATSRWRDAHPIPPAYSVYGYIETLVDQTRDIVRAVIEDAQRNPGTPGSNAQKIGTLYGTCMDTAAIERAGLTPIEPEFARIAAIRTRSQLTPELAHLNVIGVDVGFDVHSTQDFRDSRKVIAELDPGGLGLPERDYYLRLDKESQVIRGKYVAHVAKMLALSGDKAASRDASAILAFETALARATLPVAETRDPQAVYHPMSAQAAGALIPRVTLAEYLRDASVPVSNPVNVAEPGFLRGLNRLAADAPPATWRAYFRWHLLDAYAQVLPKRFDDEHFSFAGSVLSGRREQLPRWKRCVGAEDTYLGLAVGRAYVDKAFSPQAKQRATDTTLRIRDAFSREIAGLSWMSPPTKKYAQAKLAAMGFKIGYPGKWRDYSGYEVTAASYYGNVQRGHAFERAYDLEQIGKPVDRTRWDMNPQTVNAYNDTSKNEIVLPAAQFQPPFFSDGAGDPANLGATGGATIGHEMTHGFDDEGRRFDLHGNLRNWWTTADLKAFTAKAGCIIRQFDDTVAIDNVHYQGKLVAGEAIADLGGMVLGYRALESSLAGKPQPDIDGFSPEQQFFLAFAQSWTENVRPESARNEALTDPHPLPRDRVDQTVADIPQWYSAFNCPKPPKPVCVVW
jgi:putative endopeptidase